MILLFLKNILNIINVIINVEKKLNCEWRTIRKAYIFTPNKEIKKLISFLINFRNGKEMGKLCCRSDI